MAADRLSATFAALADPTRRAIVRRLAQGEATVGALARPFAMSLPAISKHLAVLERARLIARAKRGRERRCRLRADSLVQASRWLERYRRFWQGSFDRLALYLDQAEPTERKKHGTRTSRPRRAG